MPYFLNLKGYEMHSFGLATLKPFANWYSSPAHTLQCWGSIGDKEHNFMFQHCHGGAGDDFTVRCYFFCNNFVQDCSNRIKVILDNVELSLVNKIKFLGVLIDRNLTWKDHRDTISETMLRNVEIIYKMKYFDPKRILLSLYYILVMPYLT